MSTQTDTKAAPSPTTKTDAATHPAPAPRQALTMADAVNEVAVQMDARREQFSVSLPPHISSEKFKSTVLTAVNLNPDLMRADRRSLFNSCSKAAADGLLPDGREGALVIYKTKEGKDDAGRDRWIQKVQWMPMVYGIIKKIRQSGEIASIGARIVYQAETVPPTNADGTVLCDPTGRPLPPRFRYIISDGEERLEHEPLLWGERGPMVLVYAYARFKDGTKEYEPMTKADLDKIQKSSKSKDRDGNPYGPWKDWYDEMAKKSAIRRLAKRLPLSAEIMTTISRDDDLNEIDIARLEARRQERQTLIGAAAEAFGETDDATDGDPAVDGDDEFVDDSIYAQRAEAIHEMAVANTVALETYLAEVIARAGTLTTMAELDTLDPLVWKHLDGHEALLKRWTVEGLGPNMARLKEKKK